MKEYLLELIRSVQDVKREKNILPNHINKTNLKRLILEQVEKDLQELVEEGKVLTGPTINDEYYKINHPESIPQRDNAHLC